MPMPYTYMVKCFDGTFYIGSTWSLERRIWQHNHGKDEGGANYTAALKNKRLSLPVTPQSVALPDKRGLTASH